MVYLSHQPQPPLSDFIESLWFYDESAPLHPYERILPHGYMQVVFRLQDDPFCVDNASFREAVITGLYSRPFVIDAACQSPTMGIAFKPGGAFPFFDLPLDELANAHVPLDVLWKERGLRDQLLRANTPQMGFRVLEAFLMCRLVESRVPHPAVAFALREFCRTPLTRTLSTFTNHIGMSSTRFIQLFRQQVGITPKLYCRIQRFQHAVPIIRSQKAEVDWIDLALHCGYFDQAHFIHDFQSFSGMTPTQYRLNDSEHQNHVPLRV